MPSHSDNEIDCFLPFIPFLRVFRCRVSTKMATIVIGQRFEKKGRGEGILYRYILLFFVKDASSE